MLDIHKRSPWGASFVDFVILIFMKDKKYSGVVFIVAIVIIIIIILAFVLGKGDGSPATTNLDLGNTEEKQDLIQVDSPKPGELITSNPLHIAGKARGNWFFEASFPIKVLDENGKLIGQGIATAQDDWMTTDFVPFEGLIRLTEYGGSETRTTGKLILERDNPSGLPENADQVWLPTTLPSKSEVATTNIFLVAEEYPMTDCERVTAVTRNIATKESPAKPTILALIAGPASDEEGFTTGVRTNTKLNSLEIREAIAYADFSKELEVGVAGSCLVTSIRSQIMRTLLQFPTVKGVVISIEGRDKDILQP